MLSCKGEEAKVEECKMTTHDITCQHDQDVVLECDGANGDVTGKSQYMNRGPVPVPKLGKLGLAERNIDCNEKGYDVKYRGDPGSIYLLNCPSQCGDKMGMLWGTGIYTSDSYICKSALHGGILGPEGGKVLYIKAYGQRRYVGSTQNGGYLSADVEKDWPSSFSLSAVNSAWLNMLPLTKATSFIEMKNHIEWSIPVDNSLFVENKIPNYYPPVSYIHKNQLKIIPSSFLEGFSIPTPVFKWTPPDFTYQFTPSTNNLFESPGIPLLKEYTIIFEFYLKDFKNENTFLLSYPGCGGFNIFYC